MPIAASTPPGPAFMIMISGAMVTPGEQIAFEAETALGAANLSAEERSLALDLTRQALRVAQTGQSEREYFARVGRVSGTRWYRASPTPGEEEAWFFRWLRPIFDFDPRPFLAASSSPLRAYYGGRDTLVPARLSRARLEALYQGGRAGLLTVIEHPEAGHDLRYENPQGERVLAFDYLNLMSAWIEAVTRQRPSPTNDDIPGLTPCALSARRAYRNSHRNTLNLADATHSAFQSDATRRSRSPSPTIRVAPSLRH
ncbi:MAG: alpha/beta fold hydrolase [Hyphomonadaceae bacterium]